jgi:sugar O-acyltransferase (sialic acid O-acetyltransferase NeuD family)
VQISSGRVAADRGQIYVAGTGSFALELVEYARDAGFAVRGLIELVDDGRVGGRIHDLEVVAVDGPARGAFVIGAGGDRQEHATRLEGAGWEPGTVVHPTAHLSPIASVANGTVVAPGVVLGAASELGAHVLVGRGSLVGHHVSVAPAATLNPGSNVAGNVRIGARAVIGMGAVVANGLEVGAGAVVAAGAVVVRDVDAGARVQGVPARAFEQQR